MKKRTPDIEADLDPAGTEHSRPGGYAAGRAVAATKPPTSAAKKRTRTTGTGAADADAKSVAATGAPATPSTGPARGKNALDTIEADLDAAGTTRTRPGGYAAAKAVENTKPRGRKR